MCTRLIKTILLVEVVGRKPDTDKKNIIAAV